MKVLHVTKKYPNALGGDAVVVANLEKEQHAVGMQTAIITSRCDEIVDGSSIHKFGLRDTPAALDGISIKRLISLLMLFFKAFSVIAKEKPSVIHSHSIDMAFFVSFAARFYKVPIVHTFHVVTFNDPRQRGLRSKVELWLLKGAQPKRIFLLNPADEKDFAGAGFSNTVFVPNGVDIASWRPAKTRRGKPKKVQFIAVGRLEEQKGFEDLINAAARLSNHNLEFKILIVGEGSLQQQLQRLITTHELDSVVMLVGRKTSTELKQLYAESDAFILPSLWEGMPLSLLEAWASGLPTICHSVSSVPFIAKGISDLYENRNLEKLSSLMSRMITKPAHRARVAHQCSNAVHEYTWDKVSRAITEQYEGASV